MTIYSIKDIEQLTSIKAHTLRIWEKRYNITQPKRTKTNIRYYDENDLRILLDIQFLRNNGYKISKIAELTIKERVDKILEIKPKEQEDSNLIDAFLISLLDLDESRFKSLLNSQVEKTGILKVMDNYIYPLLDKISVMWIAGTIKGVHENFVTRIIQHRLIIEIEALSQEKNRKKTENLVMLYLPEYEHQQLSLLLFEYMLIQDDIFVFNLGEPASIKDVLDAVYIKNPSILFTIINTSFENQPLEPYINTICNSIQDSKLVLTGYQLGVQNPEMPENATTVFSLSEALEVVKSEIFQKQLQQNS